MNCAWGHRKVWSGAGHSQGHGARTWLSRTSTSRSVKRGAARWLKASKKGSAATLAVGVPSLILRRCRAGMLLRAANIVPYAATAGGSILWWCKPPPAR